MLVRSKAFVRDPEYSTVMFDTGSFGMAPIAPAGRLCGVTRIELSGDATKKLFQPRPTYGVGTCAVAPPFSTSGMSSNCNAVYQ